MRQDKIEKDILSDAQIVLDDHNVSGIDFEKLWKVNQEVVGWIYIENTNIDYPILQTVDNQFYLEHDLTMEYNSCGSIFMDCHSSKDFTDKNTIIYGHNLLSGKMFTQLGKILNGELGKKVMVIIYTDSNTVIEYEIFSAYKEVASIDIVKRDSYEEIVKISQFDFDYHKENINNPILTLITCDATGKNRIVVSALAIS